MSLEYETSDAFAVVFFIWNGTGFTSRRLFEDSKYAFPESQTISQVVVHGLAGQEPDSVKQDGNDVPSFTVGQDGGLVIDMPTGVAPDQLKMSVEF